MRVTKIWLEQRFIKMAIMNFELPWNKNCNIPIKMVTNS